MALFKRKSTQLREPEDVGFITPNVGAAIWRLENGNHDVRVGPAYQNEGRKASVKTTCPLSLFDELVESIGELSIAFAADPTVPTDAREMLGRLGRSILVMIGAFREDNPVDGDPVAFLSKVAGEINGASSEM